MSDVTLTITSKGQVTLKRALLDHLGVKAGDKVEVRLGAGGKVELVPANPKPDISAIFGLLHRPGQPLLTQKETDDGIGQLLADEDDRIRREWAAAHPSAAEAPRKRVRGGR